MMDLFSCREISFFAQIAPIIWDRHPSVFSRLVFRHPQPPQPWMSQMGSWRVDGTGRMKRMERTVQVVSPTIGFFFPLFQEGFFIRPIDLLGFLVPKTFPKTLTRLFLNECGCFFFGDVQASQDPSRRKVSSKKRQNRGDARWVSAPFFLRRKDLRCHWDGASSRAPTGFVWEHLYTLL